MQEVKTRGMTQDKKSIDDLLQVMSQLRDPQTGCEWDIQQTWQSIIPYTLEEVYEVADAVDRNDASDLCDELGDLLLQVVFLSQIASEQGLFDFQDVTNSITSKMINRHPHIFGDKVYANSQSQKQDWEQLKQTERQQQAKKAGFFADIPKAMPELRRSQKLQKRAARVGFDWENWQQVVPKVHEELDEVADAVNQGESFARIEEEMGDVIMATTNMARMLGVNAENALRLANRKFEQRFLHVEAILQQEGISLEQASLTQMDQAWEKAKRIEKNKTPT